MANQKVTQLTIVSIAKITDLIYVVTYDDDGDSLSVAMSLQDVLKSAITGVNRIISGQVVWTGVGFVHQSVNLTVELNGILYFSNGEPITNADPDGSNPRFDQIFFDANGLDIKEGTPAGSPTVPSLDNPTLEISTNIVLVTNGETTPTGVSLDALYSENLQESGGEWDTFESTSGARIDLANAVSPINLVVDIKANSPNALDFFNLSNSAATQIADFQNLRFKIKSLGNWKRDYVRVEFYDGVFLAGYAFINSTSFDTTDTSTIVDLFITYGDVSWTLDFVEFDIVRIFWYDGGGGSAVSSARFQIDLIKMETGGISAKPLSIKKSVISPNDYTGTDTVKIQLAANDASSQEIPMLIPKKDGSNTPWDIEDAILLGSNTTIIIDGAILQLTDTSRDNFFRTENCGLGFTSPYTELENIHILGKNNPILRGADNPRASGDSGKILVTDTTNDFTHSYGTDADTVDTGDWRNMGILFAYTNRYSVKGIRFENTHCWAISNERCTGGRFENLDYEIFGTRTVPAVGTRYFKNGDGIDLVFGCSDMIVKDITGHTDDDTVAVGLIDNAEAEGVFGTRFVTGGTYSSPTDNIHDITIKDVSTSTTAHNLRLINNLGSLLYNISIENMTNINSTPDTGGAVIVIGSTNYGPSGDLGELYNVSINNIKNENKPDCILVSGGLADSNISNVIDISTINNNYPVYFDASGVGSRNVQMSNIFKTDEAFDLAAFYDGDPAVLVPLKEIPIIIALSDTTTALSTGIAVESFPVPFAFELLEVKGNVGIAGTTTSIIVDINLTGTGTIMTTNKIEIEATEKSSKDATTQPTLTTTTLADDDELTFDIDSVDSGGTGRNLKVTLIGYRI